MVNSDSVIVQQGSLTLSAARESYRRHLRGRRACAQISPGETPRFLPPWFAVKQSLGLPLARMRGLPAVPGFGLRHKDRRRRDQVLANRSRWECPGNSGSAALRPDRGQSAPAAPVADVGTEVGGPPEMVAGSHLQPSPRDTGSWRRGGRRQRGTLRRNDTVRCSTNATPHGPRCTLCCLPTGWSCARCGRRQSGCGPSMRAH